MATDTCKICHSLTRSCSCMQTLTAFMGLLLRVDRDVSSIQVTSGTVGPEDAEGCIDKLSLLSKEPIPRKLIEDRLRSAGTNYRVSTLADRKWYLSAGDGLQFFLGHPEQQNIHKIITRPSAFPSWRNYEDRLETVFGEWIDGAKIIRLDLTVDYAAPFNTTLQALDVTYKKQRTEYEESSGIKTGIKIGSGTSKIIVYDKGLENGSHKPTSRIELQLSGRSVPKVTLRDIPKFLKKPDFEPFNSIKLHDITLDASAATHPEHIVERLKQFETLLRHTGYFGARKAVSQSRNFERDYLRYMTRQPWTHTPDSVLRQSLINFFRKEPTTWTSDTRDQKEEPKKLNTAILLH